jgi:hypothetical protein
LDRFARGVSLDLRFSCFSVTTGTASSCRELVGGLSLLFFSPDDAVLRFLLFERPKGKHQHIAIQKQVSDRYAPEFCVWYSDSDKL